MNATSFTRVSTNPGSSLGKLSRAESGMRAKYPSGYSVYKASYGWSGATTIYPRLARSSMNAVCSKREEPSPWEKRSTDALVDATGAPPKAHVDRLAKRLVALPRYVSMAAADVAAVK